ncbi:MAG: FtsX-like permease family protein [Romboutsia sp.]|uniref:FtsX-like permease family protein n=1 Tax=Clostridium sp. DSM 8431 TaxID=1761781 RepID=UPI0008E8ED76|nr:FtsX-like permease family protein [Clostridium sp. DSM 8431]MBQ3422114.1 FtsX-like permease family protein [Romboutsia sp.]SFU80212.1 putative ABC transport system permease protein [Clostridium sp. DSM 8431]
MSISVLFFKRNIKKFFNIIFSLTFFILIFNFIIGFILNVTNNYKSDIVDNSNLYFMQIENKDLNYKFDNSILDKIKKIDGVEYAFFDYEMNAEVLKENKSSKSSSAIIPVSKEYLKYFGVEDSISSDKFFLLNTKAVDSESFNDNENIELCAHIPTIKDGEIFGSSQYMTSSLTKKFTMPELLYFPPETSIIDPSSFQQLFNPEQNNIGAAKIIVICPKVDNMKTVCKEIENLDDTLIVKYALKTTNSLPEFAVTITTISSIILLVFLVITIFNISSNIKQLLVLRKRDVGLLYLLGIEQKNIYKLFISEFFMNGIITFILSLAGTIIISIPLNYFFKFNLISKYILLYFSLDFLLVIGLLLILGTIQLKKLLAKLTNGTFYKEILK